jgi:uncharacterized protein
MIELKESRYNYRLSYDDQILFFNGMTRLFIPVPHFLQEIVEAFLTDPQKALQESPNLLDKLTSTGLLINSEIDELEVIRERYHRARNATLYQLVLSLDEPYTLQNKRRYKNSFEENRPVISEKMRYSIKRHLDRYVVQHHITQLRIEWFGEGLNHHLQDEIKDISMYAAEVCQTNNIDFQIGLTTHEMPFQEQDIALLKTLPLRSIRMIVDLETRGKQQPSEEESISTFISSLKAMVSLFPEVLFIVLIRSELDSFHFHPFLELMNKNFPEPLRKNISIFVHDELYASRPNSASIREDMLQSLHLSGYNQQWEDLLPMICSSEKRHSYTINCDGSVGKCVVGFNQNTPGYLTTHGNVYWEETTTRMDSDIPLFENMRCLSCKHLPLCMGQCIPIQRTKNVNFGIERSDCLLPPWGISPESAIRNYCSRMMKHYVNDDETEL